MATSIGKDVQCFFVRLAGIGNPDDGPKHHFVGLGQIGSPSHYIQDGMGKLPEDPMPHRLTGKPVAGVVSSLKGLAQDLYLLFQGEAHSPSSWQETPKWRDPAQNNTDGYRPLKNISQSLSYIDRCLLGKLLFFRVQRSYMNHERIVKYFWAVCIHQYYCAQDPPA